MIIVITGNPGVGKHTIASALAAKLRFEILDINQIAKDSGLFEKNAESNDVDTEKLQDILKKKISSDNIIVGHLAPYVLKKDQVDLVIVLRRDPYDLLQIYKKRQYSDKKSADNAASEILGVITHDSINQFGDKVTQIVLKDVSDTINEIISDEPKSEKVDWLDLVRKNNDLKKFFVD